MCVYAIACLLGVLIGSFCQVIPGLRVDVAEGADHFVASSSSTVKPSRAGLQRNDLLFVAGVAVRSSIYYHYYYYYYYSMSFEAFVGTLFPNAQSQQPMLCLPFPGCVTCRRTGPPCSSVA